MSKSRRQVSWQVHVLQIKTWSQNEMGGGFALRGNPNSLLGCCANAQLDDGASLSHGSVRVYFEWGSTFHLPTRSRIPSALQSMAKPVKSNSPSGLQGALESKLMLRSASHVSLFRAFKYTNPQRESMDSSATWSNTSSRVKVCSHVPVAAPCRSHQQSWNVEHVAGPLTLHQVVEVVMFVGWRAQSHEGRLECCNTHTNCQF